MLGFVRSMVRQAAFACVSILIYLAPAAAQVGSIRGVVTDPSGALIPGVTVTITNTASGVAQTVTTNDAGAYAAPFLNPGTYKVQAAKPGFNTVTRDALKLDVEQVARVDFT